MSTKAPNTVFSTVDEAIEIAGRMPTLRVGGSIEVRPVESATTSASAP